MSMVRFLFLCLIMVAGLTIAACDSAPDYEVPPTQAPALWLVEDNAGDGKAYIIGSIHMLPDGLNWMTPKIHKAAADADMLITEIGNQTAPDGLFDVMASDEPVAPIAARLDKPLVNRAEQLATGAGLVEADLDSMESWAVAITLARAQSADLGLSADNGVEAALRQEMAGKPVTGLETARTQLERFDRLPDLAQAELLKRGLSPTDARADFQAMLTAWLKADLVALETQSANGFMADPILRAALLQEPNELWAKRIGGYIRAGQRPFVTIGSAHLLGENSVLAQLRGQGLVVTRIQ